MAKVGDELFFEANPQKIIFRTLNSSRSAFLAFYLDERFFDSYNLRDGVTKKYQVKLKPCEAVFRQFPSVERCTLRLDEIEERLIFELICKRGIKKLYKLVFEECEALQAIYSKDNLPNKIIVIPRKILDAINNFHTSIEEISLIVMKDTIKWKTYIDDTKGSMKLLQTELEMDTVDFEEFRIQQETTLTFCLKEFKAIMNFCDSSGQPVTILFEKGGRPLLLCVKYFGVFESDFVLATLVETILQGSNSNNGHNRKGNSDSTTKYSQSSRDGTPLSSMRSSPIYPRKGNDFHSEGILSDRYLIWIDTEAALESSRKRSNAELLDRNIHSNPSSQNNLLPEELDSHHRRMIFSPTDSPLHDGSSSIASSPVTRIPNGNSAGTSRPIGGTDHAREIDDRIQRLYRTSVSIAMDHHPINENISEKASTKNKPSSSSSGMRKLDDENHDTRLLQQESLLSTPRIIPYDNESSRRMQDFPVRTDEEAMLTDQSDVIGEDEEIPCSVEE